MKEPAQNPCGSCPYRKDVPSGVWAREEYLKLPAYDLETGEQPTAIFLCHQQTGRPCAGWCGTHDMNHSLAMRFAAMSRGTSRETIDAILDYQTDVPLFSSGAEACQHGLKGIRRPSEKAKGLIVNLSRKKDIARSLVGPSK